MTDIDRQTTAADAEAERILRDHLRVQALPPEALDRIRRATEAEWRAQFPRRSRRWLPAAAAASVAALALAGVFSFLAGDRAAAPGTPLARLERADTPGVVELRAWWRAKSVDAGAQLHTGQRIEARGDALLSLHGGGNLRVARASRFEVLSADTVRLERGEIYVDIPPGARGGLDFVAITDAGEFRHLGTQFALSAGDGSTRLRVREGSVHWRAGADESVVPAGTEILIDRERNVTQRALGVSGPEWAWTESLAPHPDIEGQPLAQFLAWVSRETGRELVIADEATRRQIETIRMHGDIHGLEPVVALEAVMASTSLHLDLAPGAIRVSFAGEDSSRP